MPTRFKVFLTVTMLAGLWSCARRSCPPSGSHVATAPEQVKIYQKQPAKYERLGIVTHMVTSTTQWRENADATPAFNDLLAKAAAMGANGLLLMDDTNASTVTVGAKFKDQYYLVPVKQEPKTVIAQVVFVLKE